MHRVLLLSTLALAGYFRAAGAQNPLPAQGGGIKLSDVAGTWDSKSDSAVASVVTVSPDGKSWTLTFTGRKPIPVRVVASGGDSIVFEAGPFPSVLRPGQTVTALHDVWHYKGNTVTGTYEAHYASGSVLKGTISGTRRSK